MSTTTTQKPKPAPKKGSTSTRATKPKPTPKPESIKHDSLSAALAAFQAELPRVSKSSTARAESADDGREYAYASLADISHKAMPLLGKHGLSFAAVTRATKRGDFILRYGLTHESGESLGGDYPLPKPADTPPQQLGSAITYARRYALCSVTGIAPGGEDDDGVRAADPAKPMPDGPDADNRSRPSAEVVKQAEAWLDAIGNAKTRDDLDAVFQQADSRGQASGAVMDALNERKSELRNDAAAK